MSLINDLRLDVGDDGDIEWPTATGIVPTPTSVVVYDTSFINHLRLDIGDDENVTWPHISGSIPVVPTVTYDHGFINNLRLDIGDDSDVEWASISGSTPIPTVATIYDTSLLNDIRLDIGDDEGVRWPRPTGSIPQTLVLDYTIVTTTPYNATDTDSALFINLTIPGPSLIILPSVPEIGRLIIVKDMRGDASINNITVSAGTNTIDNFNRVVLIHNRQSYTFLWNGTEWNIV